MDALSWIESRFAPAWSTEGSALYAGMDSQSDHRLPLIYEPFDASRRSHWADRGAAHDFVASTGGGRLLDFGPGDGWPSLIVAPFVKEVHGVDAVPGLVAVQRANAERLGITNATFHAMRPGAPLPFPDESFDGAMAASSLEQTSDARATLREIRRVLVPGGRLRVAYEALAQHRGQEQRAWLMGLDDGTCLLFLSDLDIDRERARHVRLHLHRSADEVGARLGAPRGKLDATRITPDVLAALEPSIEDVRACRLAHPAGRTLARWMRSVGFRDVRGTQSGRDFAARLFDRFPDGDRPTRLAAVDALLGRAVGAVVELEAPIEADPMLTASR